MYAIRTQGAPGQAKHGHQTWHQHGTFLRRYETLTTEIAAPFFRSDPHQSTSSSWHGIMNQSCMNPHRAL